MRMPLGLRANAQGIMVNTAKTAQKVSSRSNTGQTSWKNRAHLPVRKVILCILPKEFEFFAASLGTTGDEGGRGGTRGTTGRTGTTAMKEVCWVEVGCV